MKKTDEIILQLQRCAIVPVVKLEDVSKAVTLAKALRDGGINCAEITFRAKDADKAIKDILKAYPDMIVGAGTVLTTEQAESAINAGAKFLVAPGFNPTVVKFAVEKGAPFIPGVLSPSEIERAMEFGIRYVKFFPAREAGGLAYIKAVSAPYPDIRFMPTGGISENNIAEYLSFNKVFACGGSWMVSSDLINAERWADITALSASAIEKIHALNRPDKEKTI